MVPRAEALWLRGGGSPECTPTGGYLDYAGVEGVDVGLTAECHGAVDFLAQKFEDAVDAVCAIKGQAPEEWSADGYGLSTQGQGLEDIAAAAGRRSRRRLRRGP